MDAEPEDKQALWSQRIKQWETSGESIAAWCRQRNISDSQFYYWRLRLAQPSQPAFVELRESDTGITLEFKSARICLSKGFDSQTLRQLLSQWILGVGHALVPLYNEMIKQIMESGNIFIDETSVKLQAPGKGKSHQAYARLDNNVAERAIRPLAIGRKNWLFVGSTRGGEAAAVLVSLVQTCRALGVNPHSYLDDIMRRLMSHSFQRLHELLPDQWAREQQSS